MLIGGTNKKKTVRYQLDVTARDDVVKHSHIWLATCDHVMSLLWNTCMAGRIHPTCSLAKPAAVFLVAASQEIAARNKGVYLSH